MNEDGGCVAFGIDAGDVYAQLDSETQKKWLLFERFKMALYEDLESNLNSNNNEQENEEDDQKKSSIDKPEESGPYKISIKKDLTAMNGKKYPSEMVFVEALKYLKSEAQKYLRKLKIGKIKDEEVCITLIFAKQSI